MRLLAAMLVLVPLAVRADVAPLVIHHEGRLLNTDDSPVDSTVSMTFSLYATETADTAAWHETYSVIVTKGNYAVGLGETKGQKAPITPADVAGDLFLGVAIGNAELLPRLHMGSVPLAANALSAGDSAKLGGVAADKYALKTDVAPDADKLGGQAADKYALKAQLSTDAATLQTHPAADFVLAADGVAADASKLGGTAASQYALKNQISTDAATLQTHPASDFLLAGATAANATQLGGHAVGDFVLTANNHPVSGPERLLFNFEEASSSTTVVDGSGAANNGTLSSGGLARVTTGRNGTSAVQFLGGGGLLSVPDNASLDLTTVITLEAWVYPTAYPTTGNLGVILIKPGQYGLSLTPAGAAQAYFATTGQAAFTWVSPTGALPLNTWSWVIATYDGFSVNVYVNGLLASKTPYANGALLVPASPAPMTIGGQTTASSTSLNGIIDEVRVSAVAKTLPTVPTYARVQGYLYDETDSGALTGRSLSIAKQFASTGIRVTWSDNFGEYTANNSCRWEVLFNGSPCANPGGMVKELYHEFGTGWILAGSTFVGTCFGLPAGTVSITTRVGATPGYSGPNCLTGWSGGGTASLMSIDAIEVN